MTFAPARPSRRAAFTLVEVMVSMVVVAIIMGAMASLMRLATTQFDATSSGTSNLTKTTTLLQQITAEVALAKTVTERTATAITFTVPDRNGDGQDETIRYSWTGTAGGAMTRTYNGTSATIADNVYCFNATYFLKTVGP